MGFFESLGRFFSSALGLAQGKTERLTDKMVAANAEAIRSQFRKTKEDWNKDYQEMRSAIAELINIRESKLLEAKNIDKEKNELEQKMNGAIELYKQNSDERYKQAYLQMSEKMDAGQARLQELENEINEQEKNITHFKSRLIELQKQIDALNKEEAETVADIISSQKIRELNDRLSGVASDSSSKNLEAIRAARVKSKSVAKLSSELSNTNITNFDEELKLAGSRTKHLSAFESATAKTPQVTIHEPQALISPHEQKFKEKLKESVVQD